LNFRHLLNFSALIEQILCTSKINIKQGMNILDDYTII